MHGMHYIAMPACLFPLPSFRAVMVRRAWPIHLSAKVCVQLHGISRRSALSPDLEFTRRCSRQSKHIKALVGNLNPPGVETAKG